MNLKSAVLMALPNLKGTPYTFSTKAAFTGLTVTINLLTWNNWTSFRYELVYKNMM